MDCLISGSCCVSLLASNHCSMFYAVTQSEGNINVVVVRHIVCPLCNITSGFYIHFNFKMEIVDGFSKISESKKCGTRPNTFCEDRKSDNNFFFWQPSHVTLYLILVRSKFVFPDTYLVQNLECQLQCIIILELLRAWYILYAAITNVAVSWTNKSLLISI